MKTYETYMFMKNSIKKIDRQKIYWVVKSVLLKVEKWWFMKTASSLVAFFP